MFVFELKEYIHGVYAITKQPIFNSKKQDRDAKARTMFMSNDDTPAHCIANWPRKQLASFRRLYLRHSVSPLCGRPLVRPFGAVRASRYFSLGQPEPRKLPQLEEVAITDGNTQLF